MKENKKVLVLVADYPNNKGGVSLMYVHARNRVYIQNGIDVDVLNFNSKSEYNYEGVHVITLNQFKNQKKRYDILILHAANIRNHYKFLKKYGELFHEYIFFFHGHEVLKIRDTYSKPYAYNKVKGLSNTFLQDIYDKYKLNIWKKYYPSVAYKSKYIFVSEWMRNKFEKYVGVSTDDHNTYIIPNNVGSIFEKKTYNLSVSKKFDFVTIRSNLDGSKYCIDVINRLAKENPCKKFLIIGKGEYFQHFEKAKNVTWMNKSLTHEEIPTVLDTAKCALMPTRLDAQGVMMCEMATYGIPLITSDIDICQEISELFENIIMINNNETTDLSQFDFEIERLATVKKNTHFFEENTVGKEIKIIKGCN